MRAVVFNKYGSYKNLEYTNVAKPVPKKGEALIRVAAASINSADSRMLRGIIPRIMGFGLFRPRNKILGADFSGVIESLDEKSDLKPGDQVFGDISDRGFGSLAEFICIPQSLLVKKPANLTMEEAAAVPMAAMTALQGLRDKGKIHSGLSVLINGASGGVGSFAIQIGRAFNCEVTAVCSSRQTERVREAGAHHIIDYEKEDFSRTGKTYDLILGCNGNLTLNDYARALNPRGTYVMIGGSGKQIAQAVFLGTIRSKKGGKQFTPLTAKATKEDLTFIKKLIEDKKIIPPIDRQYKLEETSRAFAYFCEGHAMGKVVISFK
jgi:NADPH:quinone reductase-like Zn-dependent oxidoreductase